MYQTKNLGLNITEIEKDKLTKFSFKKDLGDNFETIDSMTLQHRNITNCLLEVPQRIKYTLEDGTLTIKAGSVVIVPYGTTDRTNEFPIGTAFLDSNFKVADAQFIDGKFFVWAELASDRVGSYANASTALQFLMIRLNVAGMVTRSPNVVNSGTNDTTSTTTYHGFYNTSDNLISLYDNTGLLDDVVSFPVFLLHGDGTNLYSTIDQVFNGFGYIGSTVWVDKGVKGLVPNGRNEDKTLNNIVFTTERVLTITRNISGTNAPLCLSSTYFSNNGITNYSNELNLNIDAEGKGITSAIIGYWSADSTGKILSITPKKPFRAVDHNDYSTKIAELEAKITALQAAVEALQG